MHSSTYAKMLRLEEKGPSYAGLSSMLFTVYKDALDRQRAVEASLEPIIAALTSGDMDAATAVEALTEVKEQVYQNNIVMMAVVAIAMMDTFPMVREAEAAKMVVGKRSKKKAKVTPIRGAGRAI